MKAKLISKSSVRKLKLQIKEKKGKSRFKFIPSVQPMSDLKFRPRFRIETSMPVQDVESLIRKKLLGDNPLRLESTFVKGHFIVRTHQSKRHFWSPQMDISIREDEDRPEVTLIRCLLAPAPVVWTMFMFFYALTGFTLLVGLMIASSQYSLDKEMWGLWMALGAVIVAAILFILAQTGKKLSRDEMSKMKEFLIQIPFDPVKENSQISDGKILIS
jgi:hypothetical protein